MDKSNKIDFIKKASAEYAEYHSFIKKSSNNINLSSIRPKVHNVIQAKNAGKKMVALGFALLAFPAPIVSDIPGCALVVSGKYIQRKSVINIKDTYNELSKINNELKKLCL